VEALRDISFRIMPNEFVGIVGPSGCGKSTLLSLVAGFTAVTTGQVLVDGTAVTGPDPRRGVMFQEYALFPWRTVLGNVEFGPMARGASVDERRACARRYIEMVGLSEATRVADYRPMLERGAAIGASRLGVGGDSADFAVVAERMAQMCDLARDYNIAVDIEFMPFRPVKTFADALEVVRRADQPNAHIMVAPLLTTEPAMGPGYSAVAAKSLV